MKMIKEMIESHPVTSSFDTTELAECIMNCFSCAQVCNTCADACLSEDNVKDMIQCIRLNHDCADICSATGKMMSRLTSPSDEMLRDQIKACITACEICGNECSSHSKMKHCTVCAQSCNECKKACEKILSSVTAGVR